MFMVVFLFKCDTFQAFFYLPKNIERTNHPGYNILWLYFFYLPKNIELYLPSKNI